MNPTGSTLTTPQPEAEDGVLIEHRYAQSADLQIHYVQMSAAKSPAPGQRPTVMLAHGFPQSWRAWRAVGGLLARDHTVLIPDLRGFGDSGRPLSGYGTAVTGDDLMAVLNDSGTERVTLVGHDLGAAVAYFFAADHPERVDRLVFVEAALPTSDRSAWPTLWHWPILTKSDLAEALIIGNELAFVRALVYDYAERTANLDEDIKHYARHLATPGGLRAALAWFREGVSNDQARLQAHPPARLQMPVLALGGSLWADRPLHMLQEVADDVRGGTIPGVGHWIPEEDPTALTASIQAFINATTPATQL